MPNKPPTVTTRIKFAVLWSMFIPTVVGAILLGGGIVLEEFVYPTQRKLFSVWFSRAMLLGLVIQSLLVGWFLRTAYRACAGKRPDV